MERSVDIVVSGHLCLDLLPMMDHVHLSELPSPGRLFEIGPMSFSTGGAVSNTGLALHKLGVNVALMSNVGDDLISRLILGFLESRDPLLTRYIHAKYSQASSYTLVLSPERVDRIFLHCTGTNATFTSDDLDYGVIAQAKILHLGYPPLLPLLAANDGEELARLFERAKETDVVTSLDTSLPDMAGSVSQVNWGRVLARALPFIDIFVPSLEEILFMLRPEDYIRWYGELFAHMNAAYLDNLADELFQMSRAAVIGFKLGEFGIYLRGAEKERFKSLRTLPIDAGAWAGRQIWHPAFKVEVAGTTGAGDSAYAGLLTAMLKGLSLEDAARWACAVGACNVEATDATSGIRTWESTQRRLASSWEISNLRPFGF